jgi:hypothetical protein
MRTKLKHLLRSVQFYNKILTNNAPIKVIRCYFYLN